VISTPAVIRGTDTESGAFRAVTILLLIVFVLVTPAIMNTLLLLGVVIVLLVVALGWIGIRLPVLAIMGLFLPRRGRRESEPEPVLAFRWQGPNGPTDVRLRGWDHGAALGDLVSVTGWRRFGILWATRVVNHTTNVTMRRSGLIRLGAFVAIDLYLILAIVAGVVTR